MKTRGSVADWVLRSLWAVLFAWDLWFSRSSPLMDRVGEPAVLLTWLPLTFGRIRSNRGLTNLSMSAMFTTMCVHDWIKYGANFGTWAITLSAVGFLWLVI